MNKKLHTLLTILFICFSTTIVKAQSQVYFRESFNGTEGEIATTAAASIPGQYILQPSSGVWYTFGVYRTSGATGACYTDPYHIRLANLNATDSGYVITPTVNYGINEVTFTNGRASRRITVYKTSDTSAISATWTLVAHYPTTNTACQVFPVTVNDPLARRLKIIARAGTDSDLDSIIVTSSVAIPLPVKFTGLSALETNGKIKLNWKISTEINAAYYAIEKSVNGLSFTEIGMLSATNAGNYNWIDNTPAAGNSFYRIRAIDKDGAVSYTSIVKINLNNKHETLIVAPNPVRGGLVNLQMANFTIGSYAVRLFGNNGQQLFNKSISYDGGSASYQLQIPTNIAPGTYNLQLVQGNIIVNRKLIIE